MPSIDLLLDIRQTNMNKVFITFLIISYYLAILVNCARPSECELKRKVGRCRAMIPSYYFDPLLNKCELFMYGGCDGK